MPLLSNTSAACILGLSAVITVVRVNTKKRSSDPFPPGPKGVPILGNALQIPQKSPWLQYDLWAKEHGDVFMLTALGQQILMIGTREAAVEILNVRSALSTDRPRFVLGGEMVGWADSIPLCPTGTRHREYRKLLSGTLSQKKSELLHSLQEQKTREFMQMLLESPEKFLEHIRRSTASTVFEVSHGYSLEKGHDPMLAIAERADWEFGQATAPGFIVDMVPVLRHLPSWVPGFPQTAKKWRETMVQLRDGPYDAVKAQVQAGTAKPSFTADLIESNPNRTPEQDFIYRWASVGFYSAGADTTVSAIASFYLMMTIFGDVQQKAKEELDRVVGSDRMPCMADRENLPYLDALSKEVHRWNPVTPLGLPHRLTEDTIYNGKLLPKGAMVLANIHAMLHDSNVYPSPDQAMPERYLGSDPCPDPRDICFGWGRRVCPGKYLADSSLFLAIAMTLSLFDIKKPVDKNGVEYIPTVSYTSGIISHPEAFDCKIVPRSKQAFELFAGPYL